MLKRCVASLVAAALLALCAPAISYSQSSDAASSLKKGVALFSDEKYSDALTIFNRLLSDPKAQSVRSDTLYWAALSYVALGDTINASKTIDVFLAAYPNHPYVADILYQQGRIQFQRKEYEPALRVFATFLEKSKDNEMAPAALFWSGECLFSLGRLEEAEKAYRTLQETYPKNVKVEAAGYRIALIRYKYREEELLKLLKWSHEESLHLVDEFQRREKTYEQAIAVYQRRLGDAVKTGGPLTPEQEIAQLNIRIDDLTLAVSERDAKIQQLNAALQAANANSQAAAPKQSSTTEREQALELKREALDLMYFYIEWLATRSGKGK
jgi:TolA-binding protein